jgi:hypothetical protein
VAEEWLKTASGPVDPARIDTSSPNAARVWNCLLGGRDNFEADRRAARQLVAAAPILAEIVPAAHAFRRRVVAYLARDAGIRQFLDIGTGMPMWGSTHEIAQAVDPSCRVVYVDSDPVVLAHARALLRSQAQGSTSFVDAHTRDTGSILARAADTLDLAEPVGLILVGVLNFIEDPAAVVSRLVGAVAAGSYVAVMEPEIDDRTMAAARRWNALSASRVFLRDRAEFAGWLGGLDLVEPGIVEVQRWRPGPDDPRFPEGMPLLGALGRKR